jgi:hypothetical protein
MTLITSLSASGAHVATWLEHIRVLTQDIGPRGSTTEGERRAAEYCRDTFAGLGYAPQIEAFTAARSIFEPHLWAAGAMILTWLIYPLAGQLSAALSAVLLALALGSDVCELGFRDNPLRRLVRKGRSQNVIAVALPAQPADGPAADLVLMGHLDSPRTPIIFASQGWMSFYKVFGTVAVWAALAQLALYTVGIVVRWSWLWPVSGSGALYGVGLAAIYIHADRTPFNDGANDNASSAGLVLTLAERLRTEPLSHTRVWLVCTGCEETQHYGAADFYRRHRAELYHPHAIAFEMLGCAGPNWLLREGIVIPFHADPAMTRLAAEVAAEHPALGAGPTSVDGGNTEVADAVRAGIPAMAITGIPPDGTVLYWHQRADTFDKIVPAALERNLAFTWAYMQALDRRLSAGRDSAAA